jgi:hypothetical protein
MIVSYLLTLAMVFVLALIVNGLAPTFGGTKDQLRALKLVAYGTTASFLGGVFNLIPAMALLGVLASLYSIYLIYTGIAVMMRCPPDKAGVYTAVVIVCGIVASIVIIGVASLVTPGRGGGPDRHRHRHGRLALRRPAGNVTIKGPDGTSVTINPGAMADMAKRMEEAGKRMEEAQKSGDPAAAGKAMGEVMGAMTGASGPPIASADLKTMLPESVGDLKRTGIEASSGQAMGISGSTAKATYAEGDRQLTLSITDSGGLAGLATMGRLGQPDHGQGDRRQGREGLQGRHPHGARGVPEGRQPRRGDRAPGQRRDRRGRRQPDRHRHPEEDARRPRPGPDRGDEAAGEIGGRYPCFPFRQSHDSRENTDETIACSACRCSSWPLRCSPGRRRRRPSTRSSRAAP